MQELHCQNIRSSVYWRHWPGGIVMEWYVQFSIILLLILFGIFSVALMFHFATNNKKYTFHWLQGFLILIIIATSGSTLTYLKDIRNQTSWYGWQCSAKSKRIPGFIERNAEEKT